MELVITACSCSVWVFPRCEQVRRHPNDAWMAIRVFFAGFDDDLGGMNISPPGLNEQATSKNWRQSAAIVPGRENHVSHHRSYAVALRSRFMIIVQID